MKKSQRIVIWICSKFTRKEIEQIIQGLLDIISSRNPEIKPKDDFREKHPNYRNYIVYPKTPLTSPPEISPELDYKELLKNYLNEHHKPLKPVKNRKPETTVPKDSKCSRCGAPSEYLYFNDGKKRSQINCKVCGNLFPLHPKHKLNTEYFCPHCGYSLYLWKERSDVSIYKCGNDSCSAYLSNKSKLNIKEKLLSKKKSSQFKLRYQFREYHFTNKQLALSAPQKTSTIFNIRKSLNTLCLALTFHISLGLSARKTAFVLNHVFSINVSYQSVLNYAEMAAAHAHNFNLHYKGDVDDIQAGDEAYIKVKGKRFYIFFFISSVIRKITSYHIADSRGALPAIIAMKEAIRTSKPDQKIKLITDGNPSYPSGIHFINLMFSKLKDFKKLLHKKVAGIQNLDSESENFRPFKQIIERLNRTYKYHIRNCYGFKDFNGAVALTTLFVTYYNFIRPHSSLNYSVPVPLKELSGIDTIQGKWAKILNLSFSLPESA
ncbi:MAG: IS6 family transposase [Elusimicrobiota bacterium]